MVAFGKASGGGRRADTRAVTPLCVTLAALSKRYEAVLVDLSATGARLKGEDLPAIGDDLNLSVSDLKTFCTVRWRGNGECGVQFFEPLLQAEVIEVRRLAAKGAGLPPVYSAALDDWVLGVAR